jgi:peptidoglycan/xylan/chitin deacetylase (PgdA/CDA1 family)
MYHFVRDLEGSPYPEIKGLTVDEFQAQAEFVRRHFTPVGVEDVLAAIDDPERSLPPRALLLTFDDGYSDHCDNVLPILLDNDMTGCFFPPAKAVLNHEVLTVNKIHFVLASVKDKSSLVDDVFDLVDEARGEFDLPTRHQFEKTLAHPGRYDPAEVILTKRLLQRDLPEALRDRVTDELFGRYVTRDEATFSAELYMGIEDIRALREAGMWVGSHGYNHYWLDSLDKSDQRREIDRSLDFLRAVGADTDRWVIGYPYGACNASLIDLLRERRCTAGFTVEVRVADLDADDPLTLPRIDTNDLPKRGDAPPNEWTPDDEGVNR